MNIFANVSNPRNQGDIGLTAAIYYFTTMGWDVCLPITDNQNYDLAIYKEDVGFKTVQVKTTSFKKGSNSVSGNKYFNVRLDRIRFNSTKSRRLPFDNTEINYVFILTSDGISYLIPSNEIVAKSQMSLGPDKDKYKL